MSDSLVSLNMPHPETVHHGYWEYCSLKHLEVQTSPRSNFISEHSNCPTCRRCVFSELQSGTGPGRDANGGIGSQTWFLQTPDGVTARGRCARRVLWVGGIRHEGIAHTPVPLVMPLFSTQEQGWQISLGLHSPAAEQVTSASRDLPPPAIHPQTGQAAILSQAAFLHPHTNVLTAACIQVHSGMQHAAVSL